VVVGKVAYCSQVPWIMPASLRDNVTFQQGLEPARYNTVIDACALSHDLAELPAGDLTELGERGVNLSGKICVQFCCVCSLFLFTQLVQVMCMSLTTG
jgi:ABC-type transport system involved in cytochrome bd biosynthesis fused ATPase/permease subunit